MSNKIILIAIPVLNLGGTEIQVLSLIRILINEKYDVTVCCYFEFEEQVVKEFRNNNVTVVLMRLKRKDGLWNLTKKFKSFLKEISPDIVHVQYLAPGLIPIIAARLAGIKTIFATVHIAGSIAYGWKAKIIKKSLRTAIKETCY